MERAIPDFLIIGAMKSGTTTLYNVLRQHVQVNMCLVKEPNFFNLPEDYHGTWNLGIEWYRNLFRDAPGLTGEATTHYTKASSSLGPPSRIYKTNPNVKLIYIVRNPIDRAMSHYLHNVVVGREKRLIHRALRPGTNHYIKTSLYFVQLQRYLALFRREQICLLTSETMWKDPICTMGRLYDFLNIDHAAQPGTRMPRRNATALKAITDLPVRELNQAQRELMLAMGKQGIGEDADARTLGAALGFCEGDRTRLAGRFVCDVRALFRFIGHRISEWSTDFER